MSNKDKIDGKELLIEYHQHQLSRAAKNLESLVTLDSFRISIERFERYLMPVLAAWCIKGDAEFLHIWVDMITSENAQPRFNATIDVVKDGEVVFVVPPIYADYSISYGEDSAKVSKDVTDMVSEIGIRQLNGESLAVMTLDHKIGSMLDDFNNNVEHLKTYVLLGKIWKYYGLDVKQAIGERLAKLINFDDFDINGNFKTNGSPVTKQVEVKDEGSQDDVEYIL